MRYSLVKLNTLRATPFLIRVLNGEKAVRPYNERTITFKKRRFSYNALESTTETNKKALCLCYPYSYV